MSTVVVGHPVRAVLLSPLMVPCWTMAPLLAPPDARLGDLLRIMALPGWMMLRQDTGVATTVVVRGRTQANLAGSTDETSKCRSLTRSNIGRSMFANATDKGLTKAG